MGQAIEWDLHPEAVIGAACGVLLVPLRWLAACYLAAIFHECCHIAALKLLKQRVRRITIGLTGALIQTGPLEPWEELLCALAGPAGSLLLLWLSTLYPELAACGLVQGAWNMLPFYPLDGGRALLSFLRWQVPGKEKRIMDITQWTAGLLVTLMCFMLACYFPIFRIAAPFAAIRLMKRNNSCNQTFLAVQ